MLHHYGFISALMYEFNILGTSVKKIKLRGYKNSIYYRNTKSDLFVFNQIFINKDYDFDFLVTPKTIIDCGANIGLSTIYFKNRYPLSHIISIEPELNNYELLERNSKLYEGIECLNSGIWGKDVNLEIINPTDESASFQLKETLSHSELKALSINSIINRFNLDRINILKIDIEGSEKNLFCNDTFWLDHVDYIVIELHDRIQPSSSYTFFNAISVYNYELFVKGEAIVIWLKGKRK